MISIKKIKTEYIDSLFYFYTKIRKNIGLSLFLILSIVSQIVFAYYQIKNIFLSFAYSLGVFVFISLAYFIVFSLSKRETNLPHKQQVSLQLVFIIGAILLNFLILSGQFPKTSLLYRISKPIRGIFFGAFDSFDLSPMLVSIFVNNITAVFIPIVFLVVFTKFKGFVFSINKQNFKILVLLFLLYLPIIIFAGKTWSQILNYLPIYLFLAVIPEEILFRALFQSRLSVLIKPVYAIIFASLIFGLMHAPINVKIHGTWVGLASCIGNNAFGGLFIGYLYYKTESLSLVILFHLLSGVALS